MVHFMVKALAEGALDRKRREEKMEQDEDEEEDDSEEINSLKKG